MKKLIVDAIQLNPLKQNIDESKISSTGKSMFVETLLTTTNKKNQNGRIYQKDIIEPIFENYQKEFIANRNAYGELDHTESTVVNLTNACMVINDAWWKGDEYYGRIEILGDDEFPSGKIVRRLLEKNYKVGISSRGIGSVEEVAGIEMIQSDFEIICWDIVSNPSNYGSWLKPTNESKNIKEKSIDIDNYVYNIINNYRGNSKA